MNKKTKWGIIILIGAGIIGGGIYSQLPKTNDELAAADKVKNTQKNGKKILNVNAKVIKLLPAYFCRMKKSICLLRLPGK